MDFKLDQRLTKQVAVLIKKLEFNHVSPQRVFVFKSYGSRSRAQARIWSFPRIWQKALKESPAYCIEVLSEKFDQLSSVEKTKVLIHELMHIPKTFSGALLPHRGRGKVKINAREVNKLYKRYLKK